MAKDWNCSKRECIFQSNASSSIRPIQHCHLCKNVWTKPVNIRVFFRLRPSTFHGQLPFRKEAKKWKHQQRCHLWLIPYLITPKSSILIGFSMTIQLLGDPPLMETPINGFLQRFTPRDWLLATLSQHWDQGMSPWGKHCGFSWGKHLENMGNSMKKTPMNGPNVLGLYTIQLTEENRVWMGQWGLFNLKNKWFSIGKCSVYVGCIEG